MQERMGLSELDGGNAQGEMQFLKTINPFLLCGPHSIRAHQTGLAGSTPCFSHIPDVSPVPLRSERWRQDRADGCSPGVTRGPGVLCFAKPSVVSTFQGRESAPTGAGA